MLSPVLYADLRFVAFQNRVLYAIMEKPVILSIKKYYYEKSMRWRINIFGDVYGVVLFRGGFSVKENRQVWLASIR